MLHGEKYDTSISGLPSNVTLKKFFVFCVWLITQYCKWSWSSFFAQFNSCHPNFYIFWDIVIIEQQLGCQLHNKKFFEYNRWNNFFRKNWRVFVTRMRQKYTSSSITKIPWIQKFMCKKNLTGHSSTFQMWNQLLFCDFLAAYFVILYHFICDFSICDFRRFVILVWCPFGGA